MRGGVSMNARQMGGGDEPLPWLEPVEDEDEPRSLSARKMLAAIAVVLAAAALVAGTLFWFGRQGTPVARPAPKPEVDVPAAAKPAAERSAAPRPEAPDVPADAAPAQASGTVVQLGAYANQAQAEAAWKALSGRFSALGSLTKIVVPYRTGDSSGYRLRAGAASAAEAQRTCQLLRVAGENCFVVR